MNDPELDLLNRYRQARPAPVVDVAERVAATIRSLPVKTRRTERWAMAACAAVCATTAALLFVTALMQPTATLDQSSLYDLVIESQEIDVQSLLH